MSSLVSAVINVGILIIAKIIFIGGISSTIMLIPLVYIPIILQCLGIAWLLATIGVFIRDIGQIISPSISALMFLSPIFYPPDILPNRLKWLVEINPLAAHIENVRSIVIERSHLYSRYIYQHRSKHSLVPIMLQVLRIKPKEI